VKLSNESLEAKRREDALARERHKVREDHFQNLAKVKAKKKKIFMETGVTCFVVFVALFSYFWFAPGIYDGSSKCLTEKGAVMYGEDWCKYTNAQKGMFGNSFKYINYQVKTDLELRPTWVIDGKTYETVQSFERLAELTGCSY